MFKPAVETTAPPEGGAALGLSSEDAPDSPGQKSRSSTQGVSERRSYADTIQIVKPTDEHIAELASNLRQQDVDELRALGHDDMAQPIIDGVSRSSWCHAILIDGRVVAIFGVAPFGSLLDSRGVPWALGTDLIWPNRRALARMARGYISAMLREFPHLINIVHASNTAATAWLTRCGFVLQAPIPQGPHGELFHVFEMRAANV